jgi:hypothetical protein
MSAEQKTQRVVRLNVKLLPGLDRHKSDAALNGTPGLRSVIQTFPEETDEELSTLYILEVDPSNLKDAVRQLQDNPSVEYVEETARRKLIW